MTFTKQLKSEKGAFVTFVAAGIVILGLFVGISLDAGRAYLTWARTSKMVDAASLAAANAAAGAETLAEAESLATAAACDAARINGGGGNTDTCPPGITVSVEQEQNPDGTSQLGVTVTGTTTMNTSFMALGTLIGCGDACRRVNVSAVSSAVPDTLIDVVLVMDDTGTMRRNCNGTNGMTQTNTNCPIKQARDGAIALVNMLIPDGGSSNAKVSIVPFRGCYASPGAVPSRLNPPLAANQLPGAGCILFNEILALTNDKNTINARINGLQAPGGYPGTNICNGLFEGLGRNLNRGGLFGPGSRALARKIMVVLTDGDHTYSDNAGPDSAGPLGTDLNLGNPTPWPYPVALWPVPGTDPGNCRSSTSPENAYGGNYDTAINTVDSLTNGKAASMKNPTDPNEQVEIFVLRFSEPRIDSPQTTPCDPAKIGAGFGRGSGSDEWDQNLSRCLASNTVMGDPFSKAVNDHYFYAATPADINTHFQTIAKELLKKLRLLT